MHDGRRTEAIDAWTKAVALDPTDYDALFNLATQLVEAGRMAEARPYLQRFVDSAPPAFYARDIARLRAMLGRGDPPGRPRLPLARGLR